MTPEKALWKASGVFAPSYPRQSSGSYTIQAHRQSRTALCEALQNASKKEMPGYYSVYSFPEGHSREGNIPAVDCIFIDLDIDGNNYDPKEGKTDFASWRRDMSSLLARSRMVAKTIIEEDNEAHFRAVLSGHKGIHLYLDFPTIARTNGEFWQFKNGLKRYGEQVMSWLDSTSGGINIDRWVDVDASDLGRLARHPNTVHHGAEYDDETRWCVPITIEELANLNLDSYLQLTQTPRWPDGYCRTPSEKAGEKVVQAIRTASNGGHYCEGGRTVEYDEQAVKEYKERVNDNISLEDISFLTSNKPCIAEFKDRDNAFNSGSSSHLMELSIISRFVEMGVPRDVIHAFFKQIPGYNEDLTDAQIDKIIARGYTEFNCSKIALEAPQFCLGDSCSVYKRSDDIQK